MMAQKHLHELLKEDQEPFQLKDYIALRKSQLRNSPKAPRISKKCKNTPSQRNCFLSIQYSPDLRNSPLIEFPSPAPKESANKSPKSVPVRLQIPARTAAVLFEAAIKIQTQKKPRNQIKNIGYNLFGSILKKLSAKNSARKCEIGNEVGGSEISGAERGTFAISCSCENDSGVWSESNEDKSISTEFDERESADFGYGPVSPFRFALKQCPSPTLRTPLFLSPATSPSRRRIQENDNCKSDEEEEEKEQFSPVSVLDPPFEDDDDTGNNDGDDVDNYEIECSYKFVQRAKQQLLHKLRRFEKLAELDPIELEKKMSEEEEENEELEDQYEEAIYSTFSQRENQIDVFVNDILGQSDISVDMKKLIFDLVNEENREGCNAEVANVVRRRLDSWKGVQPNTIDMMVEFDFRGETEEWKGNGKSEVTEIASKIEAAMFGLLVEELSVELFSD